MFENRISNTKLTGVMADHMFRRINGNSYDGDSSLLTTARALLMNRIPADETINLQTLLLKITNVSPESIAKTISTTTSPKTLYIYNASYDTLNSNEEEQLEKFNNIPVPEGFRECTDVKSFFAQKMACRAFIDEDNKTSVVLIFNMDLRKYHLVQCIMPKLLPWYFNESRCTVLEKELLYGLRDLRETRYKNTIEAICDTDSFRQKQTSSAMATFKRRGLERKKSESENIIRNLEQTIERLNADIVANLRLINDENFKLNGVLNSLNSADDASDDLTEFVSRNRDVQMIVDDTDGLSFIIKGYLDVFDSENYRTLARNINSWYWYSGNHSGTFASRDARKKVTDAIFGPNPTFKLKTCGHFRFDLNSNTVNARRGYRFGSEYNDYYPNPHLYYNSCLGGYRSHIDRALGRGDLVDALSQCISSLHSVNVTESASFRHVFEDIFSNRHAILEGPDGQSYSVQQAYEYLVAQERNTSN